MAKPKNKGTRAYVCQGRLSRTTNAHDVLHERRVTAGVIFDRALDELSENHAGEVLEQNDAQLLATAVGRALGLVRGPLNNRCRMAVVGRAVNVHNAHVKHENGLPEGYRGKPVRTLETYAAGDKEKRPLVTVNQNGKATLRFPGLPPIRLLSTRPLLAEQPTYATVSVDGRRVSVGLVYRVEQEPLPTEGQWDPHDSLGLDLGVVEIIADSAGISHAGISQERLQAEIKAAQKLKQAMVRKACRAGLAGFKAKLDENNKQVVSEKGTPLRYLHWVKGKPTREYRRAAQRLSKLLRQRTRQRRDYRHQVAAQIARHCANHGISLIAVEKLNVKGMTQSAKGTRENPGRGVSRKRSLNPRILEQGWAQLVDLIRYKARAKGIRMVKVNAGGTSQTCSECGHRDKRSRKGRIFDCVRCPHVDDADVNAARNIADRGTYIYAKRNGATMTSIRRWRLETARRGCSGLQAPETGTDETVIYHGAPRARPEFTYAPSSNSSQLALF